MKKLLSICFTLWAVLGTSHGVSTKMDFEESLGTNSSNADEDVEVKHTIVVSTKLKNNNRRGLYGNDGDSGILTYNIGRREKPKEDSEEVPVVAGYKAVDTTRIWTPDTRNKPPTHQLQPPKVYPESVFISRNIRDDYDTYPNLAINPAQWKPSTLFHNINSYGQDNRASNFVRRSDRPLYQGQTKLHRKITEEGTKEFYCKKCREFSSLDGNKDCNTQGPQLRSWVTTAPKMKLDGKLAKLN